MRNLIKYLLLFLVSVGVNVAIYAFSGAIPDGLKTALKVGNAKEIAKYFNSSIELDILGDENVYTKTQAELIVKSFLDKHPVTNFSVLFEGGKDASQYAICKLVTSKGTFRVNLLIKGQNILQLRIEEDYGN